MNRGQPWSNRRHAALNGRRFGAVRALGDDPAAASLPAGCDNLNQEIDATLAGFANDPQIAQLQAIAAQAKAQCAVGDLEGAGQTFTNYPLVLAGLDPNGPPVDQQLQAKNTNAILIGVGVLSVAAIGAYFVFRKPKK